MEAGEVLRGYTREQREELKIELTKQDKIYMQRQQKKLDEVVLKHLLRKDEIGPDEEHQTLMDYCLDHIPTLQTKLFNTNQTVFKNNNATSDRFKAIDKKMSNDIPA